MKRRSQVPGIVSLELSPFEGGQLYGFLDGLSEQADGEFPPDGFAATRDELGDAYALASWLREYLTLELTVQTATRLLTALQAQTTAPNGMPPDTCAALAQARDKLAQAIPNAVLSAT